MDVSRECSLSFVHVNLIRSHPVIAFMRCLLLAIAMGHQAVDGSGLSARLHTQTTSYTSNGKNSHKVSSVHEESVKYKDGEPVVSKHGFRIVSDCTDKGCKGSIKVEK